MIKNFLTLKYEQIEDNIYAWDLKCNDINILKNNKKDRMKLGIIYEYDYKYDTDEFIILDIEKDDFDKDLSTNTIITRQQLDKIKGVIKQINKNYDKNIRKIEINEKFYYINSIFEIVETTRQNVENFEDLYNVGNYFLDINLAKQYKNKIIKLFETKRRV